MKKYLLCFLPFWALLFGSNFVQAAVQETRIALSASDNEKVDPDLLTIKISSAKKVILLRRN